MGTRGTINLDMDEPTVSRIPFWAKAAFFIGDALLLGVALVIVMEAPHPLPLPQACLLVVSVMAGAILFCVPFIMEHKAAVRLAEAAELRSASDQFQNLEELAERISQATGQWQTVQEHCEKAVGSAKEIGDRMVAEGKEFAAFSMKAADAERTHLRLEIDKRRRAETESIEVLVRICDHVYALYRAGVQSGQPALQEQLGLFQRAVRDAVRRLGLVAHEAEPGTPFDPNQHQVMDPNTNPPEGALIADTIASGYTMQGQALRRIVVAVQPVAATISPGEPAQLSLVPEPTPETPDDPKG
jgi:molecular chaperone GrpE (heat shock protein)